MSTTEGRCEAVRYSDGSDCPNPAKYLVPYDNSLVCGVHRRAFLRCIPIPESSGPEWRGVTSGNVPTNGGRDV